MKEITGNLIQYAKMGSCDVLVHGCNCFCTMGSGIAKQIRNHFPEAYEADLKTIKGSDKKLGSYSQATIWNGNHKFTILNAYTQYGWNTNIIQVDYIALQQVFEKIAIEFKGQRIAYPKIGCGLAGGIS